MFGIMQIRYLFIILLSVVILSCGVKKPPLPPIGSEEVDEKQQIELSKKTPLKKVKKGKTIKNKATNKSKVESNEETTERGEPNGKN